MAFILTVCMKMLQTHVTKQRTLHNRAPKAEFYVNDYEQQTVTNGDDETATKAWADEMRKLAGNKKYSTIRMKTL